MHPPPQASRWRRLQTLVIVRIATFKTTERDFQAVYPEVYVRSTLDDKISLENNKFSPTIFLLAQLELRWHQRTRHPVWIRIFRLIFRLGLRVFVETINVKMILRKYELYIVCDRVGQRDTITYVGRRWTKDNFS